jgi:glutamate-1-semialdehyde 2,1-aminomutase
MTAGLETMRQMTPEAFDRLNSLGDYIRGSLMRMFHDCGLAGQVCGRASMFVAHLNGGELVDYRSLRSFSRTSPAYGKLCHEMLERGIIISPRGVFGCLSTPMGEPEADAFVDALDNSIRQLGIQF